MFVCWPFHPIHLLGAFNPPCAFIAKTFQHINSKTTFASQLHLVNVSHLYFVGIVFCCGWHPDDGYCLLNGNVPIKCEILNIPENVLATKRWTLNPMNGHQVPFGKHNNLLIAFEVGRFKIFKMKVLNKWWCVIDLKSHVVKQKYESLKF